LQTLKVPSQPQMKIRTVGQDGDIRPLLSGGADELAILAMHARDVLDHFHQTDHRDTCGIHYGANTGALHALAGASEKFEVGIAQAERRD
jgi:hypothetical protein